MPRRPIRKNNNTTSPPLPPLEVISAAFQAAVSAAVIVALAHSQTGNNGGNTVKELEAWTKVLQKSLPTKTSQMPNFEHLMEREAW